MAIVKSPIYLLIDENPNFLAVSLKRGIVYDIVLFPSNGHGCL